MNWSLRVLALLLATALVTSCVPPTAPLEQVNLNDAVNCAPVQVSAEVSHCQ